MHLFLKKSLLICLLIFNTFLFADGTDIPIYVSDPSVNETAGTVTFTITLDQAPVSIFGMTVKYVTRDGSATATSDYEEKTGGLLDFLYFPYGVTSRDLTLDIYDDVIYEGNEDFYLDVSTSASGYQLNSTGMATIIENELQALEITPFGKSVNENDGTPNTLSFRVQLNQVAPAGGVDIVYNTSENSNPNEALNGSDYTDVNGTVNIPAGQNVVYINVPILGDTLPESEEHFYLNLTSTSKGTITSNQVEGTIYDNDTIKVSIDCNDTNEGNIGDTNTIPCRIYLQKNYPIGEPALNINYISQDGSANVTVDYTESNGTVTFNTGDLAHIVHIPIIGDNEIEPHESVSMSISGATSFINSTTSALILNDDGAYPSLSFESNTLSIVEGNNSQKFLDVNVTLNAIAPVGASFHYETWDDTATNESLDNDYIYTHNDVNLTAGVKSFLIQIPINGDTKIENDESFYLGFNNIKKLSWGTYNKIKITIVNDDGDYPKISITDANVTEGDSGINNMQFEVSLDKAPASAITLNYEIFNGDNSNGALNAISPVDYINNNVITPISLDANTTTYTINVPINGDTTIEQDEEFYIKLTNATNATFSKAIGVGTIISDDIDDRFTCNANASAYVFGSTAFNNPTDAYGFNLSDGTKVSSNSNIHPSNINAIGYNIKDNYIWGYDRDNYKVVSVNKDYNVTSYDIAGLPTFAPADDTNPTYHIGDVSLDGIFHLATISDNKKIYRVDVNPTSANYLKTLAPIKLSQSIDIADFGFSPLDKMLYAVNQNYDLIRINPSSGAVSNLGKINLQNSGTVVSIFFDKAGHLYAHQSGTGDVYQVTPPANYQPTISATLFSNIGATTHGDGARCPYATVTQHEGEPFICDSTMYISSSIKRGSGETGNMWLHQIDTSKNPFGFSVLDDAGVPELYNALAYSEVDNYIYALYFRDLLRISSTGKVINVGKITNLPALLDSRQLYAGASYNGEYYVSGPGSDYDKIFKINIADQNVTEINLTKAISIKDFSFSADGSLLYGIVDGGSMVKIDVMDGNVTTIGSAHIGYEFDSTFSDATGRFFANDSNGNGFFEFNVKTGTKLFLSNSQPALYNDGANCLNATLTFNDYGDAPLSYGPVWHKISNGIRLGDKIDHDIKPFDTVGADGDDLNGVDDDDGVVLFDGSDLNGTYFELGVLHELNVTLAKDAYLNIWIDKDIDGSFNNANDLIYNSNVKLTAGTHTIGFTLPLGLPSSKVTYLRARVSSYPNRNPIGFATDGEVEDYAIKFGSKALRGRFNIERTNSGSFNMITQADERNTWYTQYVGRDFNYSIVFYEEDFSAEKNVSNVTLNVELMDMDAVPPTALYQYEFHIPESVSTTRIDITKPFNDLATLPATKNALFKVTYGVDVNGGIVQSNCLVDKSLCGLYRPDLAKDAFAIRPKHFYMAVSDNDVLLKENNISTPKKLRVAAGYDYNLTIIASSVQGNAIPSLGYETPLKTKLEFLTKGTCADESNITLDVDFKNGQFKDINFSHFNVGEYLLSLKDTVWTKVDADKSQCKLNNSDMSVHPNLPSGCDIETIADINFLFFPYQFTVDLDMNNLPSNIHSDFIYMSEMNSTENNVSLQFEGNITAEDKDGNPTQNFTDGCVAENIRLIPDVMVQIDDGVIATNTFPTRIRTAEDLTQNREDVNLTRRILYNNDVNDVSFSELTNIGASLDITSDKFLDSSKGIMNLDLRYNIKKHPSLPINPVQMTFNALNVSSDTAWSLSEGRSTSADPYIPVGRQVLGGIRNFYFAQVASDKIKYPRVNFNKVRTIRTPLNVDIFCNTPEAYCTQTNVFANTNVDSSPRKQKGWYLSINHDGANDGFVTGLNASSNNVNTSATPLVLTSGRNGLVSTWFSNCSSPTNVITISSTPALSYNPNGNAPYYVVECTSNDASEWTGVGKSGNILDSKSNVSFEGKMDW